MTKSIREKERLHKIRQCKANNITVTPDLLKVRLTFSKIGEYKKFYNQNIQNTLLNKSWIKDKLYDTFKKDINERLINIANHLEIYNLTLRVIISISEQGHMSKNPNESQALLILALEDNNGKSLGTISVNEKSPSVTYKITFDSSSPICPDILKPIVKSFDNEEDKYTYKLILHYTQSIYYSTTYKTNLATVINNVKDYKLNYLKYLGVKTDFSIKYILRDSLDAIIYSNENVRSIIRKVLTKSKIPDEKPYIYYNMHSFNKLAFIKSLIDLGIVQVEIPEELFNIENIEEIENTIRINYY